MTQFQIFLLLVQSLLSLLGSWRAARVNQVRIVKLEEECAAWAKAHTECEERTAKIHAEFRTYMGIPKGGGSQSHVPTQDDPVTTKQRKLS